MELWDLLHHIIVFHVVSEPVVLERIPPTSSSPIEGELSHYSPPLCILILSTLSLPLPLHLLHFTLLSFPPSQLFPSISSLSAYKYQCVKAREYSNSGYGYVATFDPSPNCIANGTVIVIICVRYDMNLVILYMVCLSIVI